MSNEVQVIQQLQGELDTRIDQIHGAVQDLEAAFLEIQQPRSDFALQHFVVGQHDTEPQQYAQCVLEMQIKYDNIRRAILNKRKIKIQIERLRKRIGPIAEINAQLREIDLQEQDRAMLGAVREFEGLYRIYQNFSKKFTRADIDKDQATYWAKRLTRQATHDLVATGRVGQGNQDALRQIGQVTPNQRIDGVVERYLADGDRKILVVVATAAKAEQGLPCLEGLLFPGGIQYKLLNVHDQTIDDAYTIAATQALQDQATFLLTIEDDTFPPFDALIRLCKLYERVGPRAVVGAWYPKRDASGQGVPIVLQDGVRQSLVADGDVHEVYTIPMGCTLIPTQIFNNLTQPWFVTTPNLTQDSFFSQKAREASYRLFVDTSIRCKHIDRDSGEVFE